MKSRLNYDALDIRICILSVLILPLLIFSPAGAFAGTESNIDKENEEKDNSISSKLTTIRTKLNLNNITNIENYDRIKIVGYLNGEGQSSYLDLKDNQKEIKQQQQQQQQQPNKNLIVDLKFNQSNYISSVMVDDEYFVCAYFLDNKQIDKTNLPIYDCDEGNIGLSTDADTVTLFSTMKKYSESNAFYKTRQSSIDDQIPEKIKITIKVPVYDAKDIDHMNVVGMIKGEYKIKTINVQDEINKASKNQQISVPLTFDRQTESGPIQPGDMFFGCATSDEFPNQNSDCEKRILKNLNGSNSLCARKDNTC